MKEIHVVGSDRPAVVDDADYLLVSSYKWYALKNPNGRVYASANASRSGGKPPTSIRMHRLIMGKPSGLDVDHWDRDGLNNMRSNLRICSKSQNSMNKIKQSGAECIKKGVARHGSHWRARIMRDGKPYSLGTYATQEEAGIAYDVAAKRLFGQFARTNSEVV